MLFTFSNSSYMFVLKILSNNSFISKILSIVIFFFISPLSLKPSLLIRYKIYIVLLSVLLAAVVYHSHIFHSIVGLFLILLLFGFESSPSFLLKLLIFVDKSYDIYSPFVYFSQKYHMWLILS